MHTTCNDVMYFFAPQLSRGNRGSSGDFERCISITTSIYRHTIYVTYNTYFYDLETKL